MNDKSNALGAFIRERRNERKLSVRALADVTNVSASYVSSIENGRNSATGRAPEPSLRVLRLMASALEVPLQKLTALVGSGKTDICHACHDHRLVYSFADETFDLIPYLDSFTDEPVDRWIYVSDPRNDAAPFEPESHDGRIYFWRWQYGASPYPDDFLVPSRIGDELEARLASCGGPAPNENIGLIIADNSAVMRWMVNPESELAYEHEWEGRADSAFQRAFGTTPIINICAYNHADIEAVAPRVDVLDTMLRLTQSHNSLTVLDEDKKITSGPGAFEKMLNARRPSGVSGSAWQNLIAAAAQSVVS